MLTPFPGDTALFYGEDPTAPDFDRATARVTESTPQEELLSMHRDVGYMLQPLTRRYHGDPHPKLSAQDEGLRHRLQALQSTINKEFGRRRLQAQVDKVRGDEDALPGRGAVLELLSRRGVPGTVDVLAHLSGKTDAEIQQVLEGLLAHELVSRYHVEGVARYRLTDDEEAGYSGERALADERTYGYRRFAPATKPTAAEVAALAKAQREQAGAPPAGS